ncbi:aldo/keto reductase [uncultured Cardiobacterium sp.]|uniref:aldo/keto reductase n=1 Tax=uncultured Cardiobacterium sp. TaxID=417619 RepID=UPI0034314B8A
MARPQTHPRALRHRAGNLVPARRPQPLWQRRHTNPVQRPGHRRAGRKHGKTPAQIILRWHIQDGNIAIPGSRNPKHIKENIDIFDFSLSDDMAKIRALDKAERFSTF